MDDAVTALNTLLTRFVNDETNRMRKIEACMDKLEKNPQQILDRIKANTNESGCTAVHKAARGNMSIIIYHLFRHLDAEKKDELLQTRNNDGNSPIHEAVRGISMDVLELALGEHKTTNEKIKLLQMRNKKGDTPIHYAAIADHKPSIEKMFQGVAKEAINELLKIRNEQGDTAVLGGIHEGKKEVVGYMLKSVAAGDRVNLLRMKNVHGNALRCATLADHVMPFWFTRPDNELFKLMEEKNESGQTPMHCVMSQGHANVVENMLIQANNSSNIEKCMNLLNNKDANGDTPIHCAAAAGQVALIKKVNEILSSVQWKKLQEIRNNDDETPKGKAASVLNHLQETVSFFEKN